MGIENGGEHGGFYGGILKLNEHAVKFIEFTFEAI